MGENVRQAGLQWLRQSLRALSDRFNMHSTPPRCAELSGKISSTLRCTSTGTLLFSARVPSKELAAGGECQEACIGIALYPPLCHCDPLFVLLVHAVSLIEPIPCLGDCRPSVAGVLSFSMLFLSSHVHLLFAGAQWEIKRFDYAKMKMTPWIKPQVSGLGLLGGSTSRPALLTFFLFFLPTLRKWALYLGMWDFSIARLFFRCLFFSLPPSYNSCHLGS